jgi:O6-methylguanine-DNA--protein-cysteine methyltransferase
LGTADAKDMSVLKRHDIIEQGNLDIRVISNIRSPFEEDEIIERLKYALRWLNDLPKDSSNQSISGRALVGLIFKDNEKWKHQGNEPIHNEIDYKSYLKRQSPSLKYNKFSFPKKGKRWAHYFLLLLLFLVVVIAIITDSIPSLTIDQFWKWVLVGILLLLIVAVNIVSNFKWSGFQKKSLWDWLQLLVVPSMLAFGAFYLNYSSEARDKELAIKQQQQEIVKDYFSKMQTLILEEKKIRISQTPPKQIEKDYKDYYSKNSSSSKDQQKLSPESQSIGKALTFAVLDEVNGIQKGKVITYLAEAGLINTDKPQIDLENANLKDMQLDSVILTNVNIRKAHMQNAKLSKVQFTASDLRGANFSGATLDDVFFSESNLIGSNFYGVIFKNVRLANSPAKGVCLSEKPNIKVDASIGQSDPNFITEKSLQGKFASSTTIESGKDCKEPEDKPKGLGGAKM